MSRTKDVNKPEVGQIDPNAATFEVTITKEENDLVQKLWLKPEPLPENPLTELLKDKERLEWLMSMVGWASTRDDIDRMRGEDDG